jgi:pimeloyl-ACP methyl ester carboxylesterase
MTDGVGRGIPQAVRIDVDGEWIEADLTPVDGARGVIVFAHGSGSSRRSPRNRMVAAELNRAGFSTLLVDLLTPGEEDEDRLTGEIRFDIGLLTARVVDVTDWLLGRPEEGALPIGYFGASTGAAAALAAAAERP